MTARVHSLIFDYLQQYHYTRGGGAFCKQPPPQRDGMEITAQFIYGLHSIRVSSAGYTPNILSKPLLGCYDTTTAVLPYNIDGII